jgi:MYXO-CTERM domain-containing protein
MRRIALATVLASTAASAAPFPADTSYVPLRCNGNVMTDVVADAPPALRERDVVGDTAAAAGLRAADNQFLYLRIRLDEDPAPAAAVAPFSWGMEFDLDGTLTTYELLIAVDGIAGAAGTVSVFTNQTTTLPNDPADPADQPAVATFTFAAGARSIATTTTNGGTPDFFIDIQIPWTTLTPLGLARTTPTYVWAGSSTAADRLNGDLACHDGRNGAPQLDATASDPTTGDPTRDPNLTGDLHLEGGGGCAVGSRSAGGAALWIAVALYGLRRRRRR